LPCGRPCVQTLSPPRKMKRTEDHESRKRKEANNIWVLKGKKKKDIQVL
jgi:hypothetical protein